MHVQRTLRDIAVILTLAVGSREPLSAQEPAVQLPAAAGQRLWEITAARSPELIAALREVEATQARLRAAGLGSAAVLGLETEDADGLDVTSSGVRVELSREFLGPRRKSAERALAAATVRIAEAGLAATERSLRSRLAAEVARLHGWTSVSRRLASEDSLLIGAEEALRSRFTVGEARYTDVLRLRTERLRTQSERSTAVANAAAARHAIQAMVGDGPDEISAILDQVAATPPAGFLPQMPSLDSLIAQSPVAARAEAEVQHARAEQAISRAERAPRLEAGIGAQVMPAGDERRVGPVLSAQVSLPFTARRSNTAQDQATASAVLAAEARREAIIARLTGVLRTAATRYEAARTRYEGYDSALLRGARDEREAALAAYQAGDFSLVELLDFERALTRAELDRVLAQMDAALSLSELYAAGAVATNETSNETER